MTKKKFDNAMNEPTVLSQAEYPVDGLSDPDVSDDELNDTSEHKEYMVHRDGTVINGELLNQGDYVTLHPDVAKAHTDADVRLTEVKSAA